MSAVAKKPRVVGPASELNPGFNTCTCCGRPLTGKVAWLELNMFTNEYTDAGIPVEQSQGWFPFGLTCAKNILNTP